MAMHIDEIELSQVVWEEGVRARIWLAQPFQVLTANEPFVPTAGALELLTAILKAEQDLPAPTEAPSLIVFPELSMRYEDLAEVQAMLKTARPNTLLVAGVEQLTEARAKAIEPAADLWEGASEGRFTNCAVVGCGGDERLYLQPKRIPSQWEKSLWPGRVVRYFKGERLGFSVVICSELLDQLAGRTTIAELKGELKKAMRELNLLVWVQHNEEPRSRFFDESLKVLSGWSRLTTVIAGSRPADARQRFENFGVSGVLISPQVLPGEFKYLDGPYHYMEPCQNTHLSRLVLLRYDADVHELESALADHAESEESSLRKAGIFRSARPYILRGDRLEFSPANTHLRDLTENAASLAGQSVNEDAARKIQAEFVSIGTASFLAFLDRAILATPRRQEEWHAMGSRHPGGDAMCRCWSHRICLDAFTDSPGLKEIFECLSLISSSGVEARPKVEDSFNLRVEANGKAGQLRILAAEGKDAGAVEKALYGGRPPVSDVPMLIIGTKGRWRPPVAGVMAALASPSGSVDQAKGGFPSPKARYHEDIEDAVSAGTLGALIMELSSHVGE